LSSLDVVAGRKVRGVLSLGAACGAGCRAPFGRNRAKGNAGGPDGADITSAIPEAPISIADEIFARPRGFRALARET